MNLRAIWKAPMAASSPTSARATMYSPAFNSYDKSFAGNVKKINEIDVHSVGGIMSRGIPVYNRIYKYSKFLRERSKINNH